MSSTRLPPEIVWHEGGHLSDEALAALGDEQDILPPEALSHADTCEHCARRLGESAWLSVAVGGPLASAMAEARTPSPSEASPWSPSMRTAPLPIWALVFGLGFVGLGAVPFLLGIGAWLPRELIVLQRSMPVFAHGFVALFARMGADTWPRVLVTMVSLAILLMSTFAVSRLTPREEVAQ